VDGVSASVDLNRLRLKLALKKYHRAYAERYKGTAKAKAQNRRKALLKSYGITDAQYFILGNHQKWRCAICQQPERNGNYLSVDHDHKTLIVRGLLCNRCNNRLARLGDDLDGILRVVRYLTVTAEQTAQLLLAKR